MSTKKIFPSNGSLPTLVYFINVALKQKQGLFNTADQLNLDYKISKISNWTPIIEKALEHGVLALLSDIPRLCSKSTFPKDIHDALEQFLMSQRTDNQRRCGDLLALTATLEKLNIQVISFKGPWLSHSAYGNMGLRTFWDLDILIRYQDRKLASDVLKSSGFECTTLLKGKQLRAFWDFCGQDVFKRGSDQLVVELHWAFTAKTLAFDLNYDELFQRSLFSSWCKQRIRHLSPEDELLYLCLHGSKEAWFKIKWLADLAFFVTSHPDLNWQLIWQRAKENGLCRMLALAIYLLQTVFPTAYIKNTELLARHTDKVVLNLAKPILAELSGGPINPPPDFHLSNYRFKLRERWGDKLRYLWRTASTPRELHFQLIELPDTLFPVYRAVKVFYDGLLLPGWKFYKLFFKKSKPSNP